MPRFNVSGAPAAQAWRNKEPVAKFITGTGYPTSGGGGGFTTITWPGAIVGDLGIIVGAFGTHQVPTGWSTLTTAAFPGALPLRVFWGLLTAGEVAAGTTLNYAGGGGYAVSALYRYAKVAVAIGSPNFTIDPATANVIPGYTKDAKCCLVFSYCMDRKDNNVDVQPAGWTRRNGFNSGTFFTGYVADIPPSQYLNGSNATWTFLAGNGPSGGSGTACQIIELRTA